LDDGRLLVLFELDLDPVGVEDREHALVHLLGPQGEELGGLALLDQVRPILAGDLLAPDDYRGHLALLDDLDELVVADILGLVLALLHKPEKRDEHREDGHPNEKGLGCVTQLTRPPARNSGTVSLFSCVGIK